MHIHIHTHTHTLRRLLVYVTLHVTCTCKVFVSKVSVSVKEIHRQCVDGDARLGCLGFLVRLRIRTFVRTYVSKTHVRKRDVAVLDSLSDYAYVVGVCASKTNAHVWRRTTT